MAGSSVVDRTPPDLTPPIDDDGGGGGWALLVTASGLIEAELIKGALESAGVVPVVLDASDPSPGAWLFLAGNINALVKVFVPLSMLDTARLTMLEAGFSADAPASAPVPVMRARTWWIWMVITVLAASAYLIAAFRSAMP